MKFCNPRLKAFADMLRTSLISNFLQKQRDITPKLQMEKLKPMVTVLLLIKVYKHIKFHDPMKKDLEVCCGKA